MCPLTRNEAAERLQQQINPVLCSRIPGQDPPGSLGMSVTSTGPPSLPTTTTLMW